MAGLNGLRSWNRCISVPLPASVLILPKRYAITPIALPGNRSYQSDGVALASSVGDSEEFRALRDYRPGDSPRKIHWKSWAKVGKPIFKEEQDEFFVRHALILDTFLPIAPAKNLNPNLYFVAMVSGVWSAVFCFLLVMVQTYSTLRAIQCINSAPGKDSTLSAAAMPMPGPWPMWTALGARLIPPRRTGRPRKQPVRPHSRYSPTPGHCCNLS